MEKIVKLSDVIELVTNMNGTDLDKIIVSLNNLETISSQDEFDKIYPYKVGDTIYEISYIWDEPCIVPCKITSFKKLVLTYKNFGDMYFLTKKEAEEKVNNYTPKRM